MLDKFIGVAAILTLIGFMLILVGFVPDFDLILVVIVISALAGYDFYLMLFKSRNGR